MPALRAHLARILTAAVLAAALLAYRVGVRPAATAATERAAQAAHRLQGLRKAAGDLAGRVPTQGDLAAAKEQRDRLDAAVQALLQDWQAHARGLEAHLRDGRVLDPETGKPVDLDVAFAPLLRSQYEALLRETEADLAQTMRPHLASMLGDSLYGRDATLVDRAAARTQVAGPAARLAARRARICEPEEILPGGSQFSPRHYNGEDGPQRARQAWRRFLLVQDILTRVVAKLAVPVQRRVPQRPRADAGTAEEGPVTLATRPGWRFVERLETLSVVPVSTAEAALPPPHDKGAAAALQAREDGALWQCHEIYDLEIELVAHPKVVAAFIERLGQAEHIVYTLIALERAPLRERRAAGFASLPSPEQDAAADDDDRPWPIDPNLSPERQPPLRARLRYRILQPRFAAAGRDEKE